MQNSYSIIAIGGRPNVGLARVLATDTALLAAPRGKPVRYKAVSGKDAPSMDYDSFLLSLPSLYEDWGQPSARPKSPRFAEVLQKVSGMTTPSVLQLLNQAVECLEDGEVYCEVGCYQGATLIGALLGHPHVKAYAADNFSEFDTTGKGMAILRNNLTSFAIADQVEFSDSAFEEFLSRQAFVREASGTVGAYFYDAAHDYRSQFMGLLLVRPVLAERAMLIVDDANWDAVTQATDDFIRVEPRCRLELRLTASSGDLWFWNGLDVLSWDSGRPMDHEQEGRVHRKPGTE